MSPFAWFYVIFMPAAAIFLIVGIRLTRPEQSRNDSRKPPSDDRLLPPSPTTEGSERRTVIDYQHRLELLEQRVEELSAYEQRVEELSAYARERVVAEVLTARIRAPAENIRTINWYQLQRWAEEAKRRPLTTETESTIYEMTHNLGPDQPARAVHVWFSLPQEVNDDEVVAASNNDDNSTELEELYRRP